MKRDENLHFKEPVVWAWLKPEDWKELKKRFPNTAVFLHLRALKREYETLLRRKTSEPYIRKWEVERYNKLKKLFEKHKALGGKTL